MNIGYANDVYVSASQKDAIERLLGNEEPAKEPSQATICKRSADPYEFAVAHVSLRLIDRESRTVTFVFSDRTYVTFKIKHVLLED